MKKLILLMLVLSVSMALFIYLQTDSSVEESRNESQQVETISPVVISNNKNKSQQIAEVPQIVDFKTQPTPYLNRCGLSENNYYSSASKEAESLTEEQLVALEYFKAEDFCKEWYQYLSELNEKEVDSLKQMKNEVNVLLEEFNSLSPNEQNEYAKSVLKGEFFGLKERFAIMHLLQNDYEFIEKVAREIGTTNLSGISQSARKIAVLYDCELDSIKCSKSSPIMLSNCLHNKDDCNIDYMAYLEKNHTLNEVNDFYNILEAIKKLLGI